MKKTEDIFTRSRMEGTASRRDGLLKVGALLLVLLTLGIFYHFFVREQDFSPPVNIHTANSVRRILLPDSSRAVLRQNSEITFPQTFRGDTREVYLDGEAFFDVAKDRTRPFIVHTSQADVRAIGTAFNVQAEKDHFEVGVAEGRILVITPADSSYLNAGYSAALDDTARSLQVEAHTDINRWGYATRKFVFKNTALPEVFACIAKSTGYTLQVGDKSIEKCKLTATFEDVSAEDMVDLIAESLNLTVTKDEYTFTLQGEGCP